MLKKIKAGSTFGIISPAWIPIKENVDNGISYLKNKGYKVKIGKNVDKQYGYFAGTEEERVEDLHDAYNDKEISVILATRGGWGTLRMLDKIDFDLIKKNPKSLIGYSDTTTLQLAIWARTGIGSLSGPMLAVEMGKGIHEFTEKHFWGYINNTESIYKLPLSEIGSKVMVNGKASGKLLGGCLSMVSFLQGTTYCPDFTNSILFLEDVGEEPYKIDRYLAHLKQVGIFNKIRGLILGEFLDCVSIDNEKSFTVNYLLEEYFSDAEYPVIYNFPYGHGDKKVTMPIAAESIIDTTQGEIIFENIFQD